MASSSQATGTALQNQFNRGLRYLRIGAIYPVQRPSIKRYVKEAIRCFESIVQSKEASEEYRLEAQALLAVSRGMLREKKGLPVPKNLAMTELRTKYNIVNHGDPKQYLTPEQIQQDAQDLKTTLLRDPEIKEIVFSHRPIVSNTTLGRGAFCVIHDAVLRDRAIMVASKKPYASMVGPLSQNYIMLREEINYLTRFSGNPFIVQLLGVSPDGSMILSRWPTTLEKYILTCKNLLLPSELFHIMKFLVIALKFLHGAGFSHRDMTAGNVLFDPETGEMVLCDLASAGESINKLKYRGGITLEYAPPERLLALRDVYAKAAQAVEAADEMIDEEERVVLDIQWRNKNLKISCLKKAWGYNEKGLVDDCRADIFSAGMVLFWILNRGFPYLQLNSFPSQRSQLHAYEEYIYTMLTRGLPALTVADEYKDIYALIEQFLIFPPKPRPTADELYKKLKVYNEKSEILRAEVYKLFRAVLRFIFPMEEQRDDIIFSMDPRENTESWEIQFSGGNRGTLSSLNSLLTAFDIRANFISQVPPILSADISSLVAEIKNVNSIYEIVTRFQVKYLQRMFNDFGKEQHSFTKLNISVDVESSDQSHIGLCVDNNDVYLVREFIKALTQSCPLLKRQLTLIWEDKTVKLCFPVSAWVRPNITDIGMAFGELLVFKPQSLRIGDKYTYFQSVTRALKPIVEEIKASCQLAM